MTAFYFESFKGIISKVRHDGTCLSLGGQGRGIVDMDLAIQQVSGQLSILSKTMPHKKERKRREGEGRRGEGREGKGNQL